KEIGYDFWEKESGFKKNFKDLVKRLSKRENPATNPKCVVNVQAKTNSGKDGVEIRFSAAPPAEIRKKLSKAGFVFYTPNGKPPFWAAKKTAKRVKVAESIAGEFYERSEKDFKIGERVKIVDLPIPKNSETQPL